MIPRTLAALKLAWQSLLLLALVLIVVFLLYVGYANVAWRDILVEELEQRYGGSDLRMAEIDGIPIRYRLDGPVDGSRTVVVLIHSHFFDMGIWDAWLPVLAPQFTVLRYDLSGHGLTGPDPGGDYTVQHDVDTLKGLLKHLGIESFALVGSSLGGNIAFTLAAQQPQRVRALVLVNSGGLQRHRDGRNIPAAAGWVLKLIPPQALHAFLAWMIADDRVIDERLETRFVDMFYREGNRQAELQRLRQFDSGNADGLLAAITAPTLILWGADNPQLPVALSEQFEKKLTHALRIERKTYPGAGHLLPVERPEASASDTRDFLLCTDVEVPRP